MCLVNSASTTKLIRDPKNSTGSTNSTKLHVMSGCITVGALEVTLCAGTTNTTDISGNTTIIYAFFNTSDTDDEYSLPGCHLDAHWPSNVSDIYFNGGCLTDGILFLISVVFGQHTADKVFEVTTALAQATGTVIGLELSAVPDNAAPSAFPSTALNPH
ncbi:hypothetical protein B0H14DRAFT_3453471 [Mycena olivaceomarginata]|nr:hypothetical protein B0H14DRAFT_3453471 [Mycena olivaceomarginata]